MKNSSSIYWQQIPSTITFIMGILVVLSGVFGTFALTQYRISKLEEIGPKVDRLDRSVLVIATKMGISEKELQVQAPIRSAVSYQYSPKVKEPSATPVVHQISEKETALKPTPVSTPEPTKKIIKEIIEDLGAAL